MSIQPYSFEPRKKNIPEELKAAATTPRFADGVDELIGVLKEIRVGTVVQNWCNCFGCKEMETEKECLCCKELEELKAFGEFECFAKHEAFEGACMNRWSLWTALSSLHGRECAWLPPFDNVPNRSYRYAAYRSFTWLIYTKLGRYRRRIIPSCIVVKIRDQFPDDDGNYKGFFGDDGTKENEINKAWEYRY